MKKIKTYIPSLIFSVLLVFSFLGTSALIVIKNCASSDKLIDLAEKNKIVPIVQSELTDYFSSKYNETGVPEEIYIEALNDDYIMLTVKNYIESGIGKMESEGTYNFKAPENTQLEENIENFFSDYADSINYTKDEKYEEKLRAVIDAAYNTIGEYCDIYKFRTMNDEGILDKASVVYSNLDKILFAATAITIALMIIIILINIGTISSVLYWFGITALVSGIMGAVPCIYLNVSKYFDSFTIKQPQIYTSFTSLMYKITDDFMINQIIFSALGAAAIIIYALINKKTKNA